MIVATAHGMFAGTVLDANLSSQLFKPIRNLETVKEWELGSKSYWLEQEF